MVTIKGRATRTVLEFSTSERGLARVLAIEVISGQRKEPQRAAKYNPRQATLTIFFLPTSKN